MPIVEMFLESKARAFVQFLLRAVPIAIAPILLPSLYWCIGYGIGWVPSLILDLSDPGAWKPAWWLAMPFGALLLYWYIRMIVKLWNILTPTPVGKRVDILTQHLAERGFRASADKTATLPARGLPFTYGGDHEVLMSLKGTVRGRSAVVMYYGIAPLVASNAKNYAFTITAVFTDADAPVTMAIPERGFERLKAAVGKQDMEVESAEFNRAWRLTGDDVRAAHDLMTPTVIERLLQPDARRFPISWDANAVMVVTEGMSTDVEAIDRQLDVLVDLADRMPAYQTKSGAAGARTSVGELTTSTTTRSFPVSVVIWMVAAGASVWLLSAIANVLERAAAQRVAVVWLIVLSVWFVIVTVMSWRRSRNERRRRAGGGSSKPDTP
jgi:hypothetical protein